MAAFFSGLVAVMKGIPALISGIRDLIGLAGQAMALVNKAKREGWIQEGKEITKKITEAETDEERRKLAKSVADHIRDM
jgi:hypothetical protein